MNQTHVYICGAKGISQYGGFESFIQKLLEHSAERSEIKYHVACKANGQGAMDVKQLKGASEIIEGRFTYCNADCFLIPVPNYLGSAQAVFYDIASIKSICKHIEDNKIEKPIVYILTCRIGPFIKKYIDKIHGYGGKVYLNPDGHEWARRKWSKLVRRYWKLSEKMMVKYADHIICDNKEIEKYIKDEYKKYNPETSFIPYGSDISLSVLADDDSGFTGWLESVGVEPDNYYLVVGRFVEENNFDIIIKEFMRTKTEKKLVLLTTFNEKLKEKLAKKLDFKSDNRIVITSPVYNLELLKKIRENAYAYIHGHEVGGTNPSLLEGLSSTNLNLVYGVKFNKEVARDAALYWKKKEGNLELLINRVDSLDIIKKSELGNLAKEYIQKNYNWDDVANNYIKTFSNCMS